MLRHVGRMLVRILPLCLVLAVLLAAYYGMREIQQFTIHSEAAKAATATPGGTPLTIEELKTRLDDLKWILGFIVGAAAFFAVIQAGISFFNAQSFTKQADDAVKRVQELANDAEKRFPIFTKMEEARREAYTTLAHEFPNEGLDWEDQIYENMLLTKRQRVLSVERFVGIEFVPHSEDRSEYAANLRRLANFYASKYLYEKKRNVTDLERAEYYLNLALKEKNDAFYLLNDIGVLYLEYREPPDMEKAKNAFEASLNGKSQQGRAHYNLGVIEAYKAKEQKVQAVAERHWEEAEKRFETALDQNVWEQKTIPKMVCDVLYNLGCVRARLYYRRKTDALLRECLSALEQAAAIGTMTQPTVDFDLDDPQGDLFELRTHGDPTTVSRLRDLRTQLTSGQIGKKVERDWKTRLDRMFRSLRGQF